MTCWDCVIVDPPSPGRFGGQVARFFWAEGYIKALGCGLWVVGCTFIVGGIHKSLGLGVGVLRYCGRILRLEMRGTIKALSSFVLRPSQIVCRFGISEHGNHKTTDSSFWAGAGSPGDPRLGWPHLASKGTIKAWGWRCGLVVCCGIGTGAWKPVLDLGRVFSAAVVGVSRIVPILLQIQ